MERELKIVIGILSTWLMYGIYSFFATGDFMVPYVLTPLVITCCSLLFLILNFSIPHRLALILFFIGYLAFALQDDTTLALLTAATGSYFFQNLADSKAFLIAGLFVFLLSNGASLMVLHTESKKRGLTIFCGVIFITSVIFLALGFDVVSELLFLVFCFSYFVVCHRINLPDQSASTIVSDLYFLIFALESFEFLC